MIQRIPTPVLRTGLAIAFAAPCFFLATPSFAATPAEGSAAASPSIFTMNASIVDPTRDYRYQPAGVSTSEANEPAAVSSSVADERESLGASYDAAQPPPGRRRSYGRSRYQDRLHNADGSSKIAFVAGAGLSLPVGNTAKYYTASYTVEAGAGINFNKTFGILGEFHYDHLGLTGSTIDYQYNNYLTLPGATPDVLAGLDANAHVLSITANPIVNFSPGYRGGKFGAYVTGGVGYYRKTTNFTLPQQVDSYYYSYITNATFDSYSANSFGVNGGVGLTYKLSEFSSERLFVEARYNWLKLASNNNADFFPYNRQNTGIIPITAGIRF